MPKTANLEIFDAGKITRLEAVDCPRCGHPLSGSPSSCEYCGAGFYYDNLDAKTGLARDRRFEEGLVRFMAEAAAAVESRFEWGLIAAEHYTLGLMIENKNGEHYAELSFEKPRGQGVYIFNLMPYRGRDKWEGAWLEITPIQKKDGSAVYRVGGGGLLRFTEDSFSTKDLVDLNLESGIGKIIIGFLGKR